ncbi:MAG: HD domain-containing protein [Parachlamydia sp.]|nr:HD domain-containing protein [Parachlamydia sp.]
MANHICAVPAIRTFIPHIEGGRGQETATWVRDCWGVTDNLTSMFEEIVLESCRDRSLHFNYHSLRRSVRFFLTPFREPQEEDSLTPLERIERNIQEMASNPDNPHIAGTCRRVTQIVYIQDLLDPEEYVSHTFKHSLNVARYSDWLFAGRGEEKNSARVRSNQERVEAKYQPLRYTQLRSALKLAALLHDCGYPHLHNRAKATHSIFSADKVLLLKEDLKGLLDVEDAAFDTFFGDFVKAIFYHNADKIEAIYDHCLKTTMGSFLTMRTKLDTVKAGFATREPGVSNIRPIIEEVRGNFNGRKLDLHHKKDGLLGHELTVANLSVNFFDYLRVADNIDCENGRCSTLQNSSDFRQLYRIRYFRTHRLTRAGKDHLDNRENAILERLRTKGDFYDNIASKLDQESFKHFGGCEAVVQIEDLKLELHGVNRGLKIVISRDQEKWKELETYQFLEGKTKTNIATYQFLRAYQAFEQIILSNNITLAIGFKVVAIEDDNELVLFEGGKA